MSTRLEKTIVRELPPVSHYTDGTYLVELSAFGIRFRKKGRRKWFGPLPWDQALGTAIRISVIEERSLTRGGR